MNQVKNKASNPNKNSQLLDVSIDLIKFTTRNKDVKVVKTIEYFPSQINSNINSTMLNDMINKKKECLRKTIRQDDFNDIEFT
jgi:hypothetical protein